MSWLRIQTTDSTEAARACSLCLLLPGDAKLPLSPRDTTCSQCPTPVLKKQETEPRDTVSSLLPLLMGGDRAQLLDCGATWLWRKGDFSSPLPTLQGMEFRGGDWRPRAWHCCWKRARSLTVQLRRDTTVSRFQTRRQHFSFITFWKFYLEELQENSLKNYSMRLSQEKCYFYHQLKVVSYVTLAAGKSENRMNHKLSWGLPKHLIILLIRN